eukprot:GHVT01096029.1.p1 GENE.GHVT01096029.1~~GHVT01096029.1.p1  ORF type:complete len:174 (-),score=31.26 GHVT01096029.1:339-860(-)
MKRTFWAAARGPASSSALTHQELPIHITNVAMLDPVVKRPTVVRRRRLLSGALVRISKLSGCAMPEPLPVSLRAKAQQRHLYVDYLKQKEKAKQGEGPIKEEYADPDPESFDILSMLAREIEHGGDVAGPSGSIAPRPAGRTTSAFIPPRPAPDIMGIATKQWRHAALRRIRR